MSKRLIDVDPLSGTASYSHYDDADDAFRYHQEVECKAITDFNRMQYNEPNARWGDMQRVATVPMVLWLKLKQEGILDDPKRLARWLNDPDNRAWRTRPGWI